MVSRCLKAGWVVTLLVFVLIVAPDDALSRKNNRKGGNGRAKARQAQRAKIRKALTNARKVLRNHKKQVAGARAAANAAAANAKLALTYLNDAKKDVSQAERAMDQLRESIDEANGPETALGKARQRLDRAAQSLQLAKAKILGSPEYRKAYEAAKRDDAVALAKVRSDALDGNAGYREIRRDFEIARSVYEALLAERLKEHSRFPKLSQTLKAARAELISSEDHFNSMVMRKAAESRKLREAIGVYNQAEARVKQYQALLK